MGSLLLPLAVLIARAASAALKEHGARDDGANDQGNQDDDAGDDPTDCSPIRVTAVVAVIVTAADFIIVEKKRQLR